MKKPDGIVFIDANQYIQLYGLSKKRNKVLDLLRVLQDYIFVTSQLVDEVQRNKVEAVVGYFKDSLERLPNWSGITPSPTAPVGQRGGRAKQET